MPVTPRDIDLYLKRKATAEGGGNANEKSVARAQCEEMEKEHPDIAEKARLVKALLEGDTSAFSGASASGGGGWKSSVAAFAQRLAEASASKFADDLAGEMSGAKRFEPLKRGACVLTEHRCADDQVCIEVRVRKKDILRENSRIRILEGIEDELVDLADDEEE